MQNVTKQLWQAASVNEWFRSEMHDAWVSISLLLLVHGMAASS